MHSSYAIEPGVESRMESGMEMGTELGMAPAATSPHEHLRAALCATLAAALQGSPCCVLPATCSMLGTEAVCTLLDAEEYHGVTPDVAVSCQDESAIPKLVVEILVADTLLRDTTQRLALYEALRIPEYWIVDTHGLLVHAFRLNHEHKLKLYQSAAPGEMLESKVLPWLSLPAWQGWLEAST